MVFPARVTIETEDVRFDSDGAPCAGTLFRPEGVGLVGRPVVVIAHGFGGLRVRRLDAYARRFAEAGYLALTFDYRGFGDSGGGPRGLLDLRRQHADYAAAVAFARRLPQADPDRVVLWGTSLSGGHVLQLAGTGLPAAAVIAQVPHLSGPHSSMAVPMLQKLRIGLPGVLDQLRALVGLPPVMIDAFGEKGSVAVMTSAEALPGHRSMLAAQDTPATAEGERPRVAARVVLRMPFYSPGRHAGRITAPVLLQVADRDLTTPPKAAGPVARALRRGTVKHYDGGHFDVYTGELFEAVVADQLAFLAEHVPVRTAH